nr:uncharacterized protein LOC127348145 [Lolium perenne]
MLAGNARPDPDLDVNDAISVATQRPHHHQVASTCTFKLVGGKTRLPPREQQQYWAHCLPSKHAPAQGPIPDSRQEPRPQATSKPPESPRTPDSHGSERPGRRIQNLCTQIRPETRPAWPDPARPWQAQIWDHKPRSRRHTPTVGYPAAGGPSSAAHDRSTLQSPTTRPSTAGATPARAGTDAPPRGKGETHPVGPSQQAEGGENHRR